MSPFLRTLLLVPTLSAALVASGNGADKSQPVTTTPPVAAPAFLDVVSFDVRVDGQTSPLTVTLGPALMRVDQPSDRLSVIYNSQTDHYTGLEHSNYTYWEFSWPEVREKIASSKRYEARLRDLSSEGINLPQPTPDTNTTGVPSNSAGPDTMGYVWKPTLDQKKFGGVLCTRWTGDTVSGESVEAWCAPGPQPKVQAAIDRLRAINEPIALVPVRQLVPPVIFGIYDGLAKGGVTPLKIAWGSSQ